MTENLEERLSTAEELDIALTWMKFLLNPISTENLPDNILLPRYIREAEKTYQEIESPLAKLYLEISIAYARTQVLDAYNSGDYCSFIK